MGCNHITKRQFIDVYGNESEKHASYFECCGVVFSGVRRGKAIVVHVGCKKENINNLRKGCRVFINHMLSSYKWCNMLIATVATKSVVNLCKKLGFVDIGVRQFEHGTANVMVIKK